MKSDERIDAYIAQAGEFARPILHHLRARVHAACPECEETIKWRSPFFVYRGKILANMAAFKAHAAFGLWQGMAGPVSNEAMGSLGRLTSLADLPSDDAITAMIERAMALTEEGAPRSQKHAPRAAIEMPQDFADALARSPTAAATFADFSPGKRYDYLEWVTEAKREETRARRIVQSVEWLAEGKVRHWKYQNC